VSSSRKETSEKEIAYTEEQLKLIIELEKVRQETTKYLGDRVYEGVMELVKAYKEYVVTRATRITLPLFVLLGIVFASMAVLTFFGKISGESMVFLSGAIVGYIISLLSEYVSG